MIDFEKLLEYLGRKDRESKLDSIVLNPKTVAHFLDCNQLTVQPEYFNSSRIACDVSGICNTPPEHFTGLKIVYSEAVIPGRFLLLDKDGRIIQDKSDWKLKLKNGKWKIINEVKS